MPDAIYARYSSHNQDGGTSIEVQLEQCRAVAGPKPIEYIDRAVTGTLMTRPQFNAMLKDAEAGRFNRLIVYKFDRFGRSAYAHAIVADLEAMGVKVISATEGDDPLSRGIQLVIAEDFSRKLSERTRLGRAKRFEQGKWLGGVNPFGYTVEDGRLRVHDQEAEAVRSAYRYYASGSTSLKGVARYLHELGFKPRRVREWSHGMIRHMLTLPLYRGIRRHRDREMHDESLRIVSDQLADQVYEHLTHRNNVRTTPKTVQPFTGLLHCGCCGEYRFKRRVDNYKGKKYPAKWVCGSKYNHPASYCPDSPAIVEDALCERIGAVLSEIAGQFDSLAPMIVESVESKIGQEHDARHRIQGRLSEVNGEIQNIMRVIGSGQLDDDAAVLLAQQLAALKRDKDRLTQERDLARPSSTTHILDMAKAELANLEQLLTRDLSGSEMNALYKSVIGPMAVAADGSVSSFLADGSSAGAKFTSNRAIGNGYPEFTIADRTRSTDSFTAASGNPTIVVFGNPDSATSTSTSHASGSMPCNTKL